jgi:hypothetical protein
VRVLEAREVALLKAQGRDYQFLGYGTGCLPRCVLCRDVATERGGRERG